MPIPRDELFKSQKSLTDRILDVLKGSPEQAYSTLEIFLLSEGYKDLAEGKFLLTLLDTEPRHNLLRPYAETLAKLANDQAIVHAVVDKEDYYGLPEKK